MAILDFQRPDKVYMVESTDTLGNFEFRPLEPGYGLTVGNALRRVLLSSLEGFAISTVRIEGVEHEFSTIDGIVEDVTEIILNLKQVRFRKQVDDVESETVQVSVSNQSQLKASDLGKFISYEKGCYRGQEIIARVTYLGKKNKAAVIFANAKSPITDVAGKKIGKEVFSKNFENLTLHHYYIEKNDYFVEGEQISPYASQW